MDLNLEACSLAEKKGHSNKRESRGRPIFLAVHFSKNLKLLYQYLSFQHPYPHWVLLLLFQYHPLVLNVSVMS